MSIAASVTINDAVQELNVSNLSLGGAFIDLEQRLPIGTRVSIKFSVPGQDPIDVGAQVRWVAPTGAGLQFDGLRAKEVWSLNQYLATLG